MNYPYKALDELIGMIDEPYRSGCHWLIQDNIDLFIITPGSTHNHQAWVGGYLDHVTEAMNIGVVLFYTLDTLRDLPFSLTDLLVSIFLHDIEKPWKYTVGPDGQLQHKPDMMTKDEHQTFRMNKLMSYGITLTPEMENGIKYAEGEIRDYSNKQRNMGPLAAMVHMCDVASARLFFDYPKADDSWIGAYRCNAGKS